MANNTAPDLALDLHRLGATDRPLSLALAHPNGQRDEVLIAQRVIGEEAICGGFTYRILCVADDATLALKDFIGLAAELSIVTDRGELRRICGIVTEAASGQSDGALATYQLVMRDALAVMQGRTNTRIFRNMNEIDIVKVLVSEWRERSAVLRAAFDLDIDACLHGNDFPKREFTYQHNEPDGAFIERLLQRRGIAWFFRAGLPDRDRRAMNRDQNNIGHTLVLFDDARVLRENAAGQVRFHRDAATEERDAITGWSALRTLQPGSIALYSWEYTNPAGPASTVKSNAAIAGQGAVGSSLAASLEDYRSTSPHLGANWSDLGELAAAQAAHYHYLSKSFQGEGGVRDFAVGEWFTLAGHHEVDTHPADEREFVLTSIRCAAQNNLPVKIGARVTRLFNRNGWNQGDCQVFDQFDGETIGYRCRFSCVRRGVQIVPPRPTLPQPQLQSAIVVGPAGEEVYCDALGRVRVRFPAARPIDHEHARGAGASDSDRDSAWVRVASNWAGNGPHGGAGGQSGARMLPPVGTEVLVQFAGGDPDKPVIIGQLYNSAAPPPSFRHEAPLPDTRYQSGLRSREARGERGNQLRLDDTPGQISAQLASDHAATELNLGFMTEPRRKGQGAPRGDGAELRTEEAIALRAARGILLSAWKVLGGGAKGGQLARDDYLRLLAECGELCGSLGTFAAEHNGMPIDTREQQALLARFKNWEGRSNTAPDASTPGEPVIGVTSPAGIGFASTKAIVHYSASNIDMVAQQHLQFTAGQRFSVNAGKGVSLFAQHGGVSAIAHFGKLLLQSQHDDTDIDAAKDLKLTATEGVASVTAKTILLVSEDGSFIKLGDGPPVFGSKQALHFRAPDYVFDGPETMEAHFPAFGEGGADQKFVVRYPPGVPLEDGTTPQGGTVADAKMRIALSDATGHETRSTAGGESNLIERAAMHIANVALLRGDGR